MSTSVPLATMLDIDLESPSSTASPTARVGTLGDVQKSWDPRRVAPAPVGKSTKGLDAEPMPIAATGVQATDRVNRHQIVVKSIAEWQGYVTKIESDHMFAMLDGVYGNAIRDQAHEARIPLSEVSPEDRSLVREGAYFRLAVFYSTTRGGAGTATRTSTLVFRRLPAYRESDLENAREIASKLVSGLRVE